jgi:ribosome-associated protein
LDKKGSNITLLDLREQALFADYFLICEADNDRQLQALANSIVADAKHNGDTIASGKEGMAENGWVLVDFGDLIVHLFSSEKRQYYKLEELWRDAHVILHMQ